MQFVKGKSGNPHGRPRHTAAPEIREYLKQKNRSLIKDIFDTIDEIENPFFKATSLFKLMEFLYSKPKETEMTLEQAVELIRTAIANAKRSGMDAESVIGIEPPKLPAE